MLKQLLFRVIYFLPILNKKLGVMFSEGNYEKSNNYHFYMPKSNNSKLACVNLVDKLNFCKLHIHYWEFLPQEYRTLSHVAYNTRICKYCNKTLLIVPIFGFDKSDLMNENFEKNKKIFEEKYGKDPDYVSVQRLKYYF